MKAFDCIYESAMLVNMLDVVSYLDAYKTAITNETTPSEPTTEVAKKIKKLFTCVNMAVERLASEYFVLTTSENVLSDENKKITLSSLLKRAFEVVKVVDNNTKTRVIPYFFADYIVVGEKNHGYNLTYRYIPAEVNSLESAIDVSPFVSRRVIAYSVVADLLLTKNAFDEAKFWNDKFISSIKMLQKFGAGCSFKNNALY